MRKYKRLTESLEFKCPYEIALDKKYPMIYKNELCNIKKKKYNPSIGFTFILHSLERPKISVPLTFDSEKEARQSGFPV